MKCLIISNYVEAVMKDYLLLKFLSTLLPPYTLNVNLTWLRHAFEAESIAGSQSESNLLYLIQVAVGRCYIYILYTFIVDNFDKGLIKVQINHFFNKLKEEVRLRSFSERPSNHTNPRGKFGIFFRL